MGYERSTLKLKFADPQFEGLEVRMKRLPIGDMLAVTSLAELSKLGQDADATLDAATAAEGKRALDTLLAMLAGSMLSWNLEVEGVPVPTDKGAPAHFEGEGDEQVWVPSTGLHSIDPELVYAIVEAWFEAAAGVSPPLPKNSNSGGSSPVEFELMALPSESLAS